NLYKALVKAYESVKIILDTHGNTVTLKRRRDDDVDKDEETFVGSDRGSKRRRKGKEPESASSPKEKATKSAGKSTQGSKSRQTSVSESATAEEPMQTTFEMEEPLHPKFETGADDQPIVEPSQHPEWFSQQKKPPTPDRDWNKTLPTTHGRIQLWISKLAKLSDSRSSFNELMDTPVDFSNFLMNRLKVDTSTPELLAGPTYELMKGSCKSLQYQHNLLKPLPPIPNSRGRHVIPFDHFINNDLEYLCGGASSRKYTTSVTKTEAADYGHIKCIKDLVPRTMWIQEPIGYDKHAIWGISYWGHKCQQFYGFVVNRESANDVYSKRRIIAVTELKIVEWYNYKHLDWITVRRDDYKLYKFKEGDFKRLRIQDIGYVTASCSRKADKSDNKQNRLMQIDELHKFSDRTLTNVRTALDDRLKGIQIKYLPQSIWRKSDKDKVAAMIQAIDKRLKTKRIMRSLERPTTVGTIQVGAFYMGDTTGTRLSHFICATICIVYSSFGFMELKIDCKICRIQEKYKVAAALLAEMEERSVMAKTMLQETLQYSLTKLSKAFSKNLIEFNAFITVLSHGGRRSLTSLAQCMTTIFFVGLYATDGHECELKMFLRLIQGDCRNRAHLIPSLSYRRGDFSSIYITLLLNVYSILSRFLTLLRNFDKEDLEALWSLVKERFSTGKPKNFSGDLLLTTLGAMFEKPDAYAQI
nr:hypothetical protein [Tanacetum cinerariifolium]